MPYATAVVANEFLELAKQDGESLTPMKLQKLVYFAHGWYLALTGRELLDEPIEAWRYGPVVKSLYREFKHFGPYGITNRARLRRVSEQSLTEVEPDSDAKIVIQRVWKSLHGFTGVQLANVTHEDDSPWHAVAKEFNFEPPPGTCIPNRVIADHFVSMKG